jgi:hypothetical protein
MQTESNVWRGLYNERYDSNLQQATAIFFQILNYPAFIITFPLY